MPHHVNDRRPLRVREKLFNTIFQQTVASVSKARGHSGILLHATAYDVTNRTHFVEVPPDVAISFTVCSKSRYLQLSVSRAVQLLSLMHVRSC